METKKCNKCCETKDIEQFSWRQVGVKRQSICKDCHKKNCSSHYRRNKDYYKDKARKRDEGLKATNEVKLYDYLLSHPCVDCGESEPLFLDFDHQRDKIANVTQMLRGQTWETIWQEIQKCEVRCVKCHRVRTCAEVNTYKYRRYAEKHSLVV